MTDTNVNPVEVDDQTPVDEQAPYSPVYDELIKAKSASSTPEPSPEIELAPEPTPEPAPEIELAPEPAPTPQSVTSKVERVEVNGTIQLSQDTEAFSYKDLRSKQYPDLPAGEYQITQIWGGRVRLHGNGRDAWVSNATVQDWLV